jgi:hypothetical protein
VAFSEWNASLDLLVDSPDAHLPQQQVRYQLVTSDFRPVFQQLSS